MYQEWKTVQNEKGKVSLQIHKPKGKARGRKAPKSQRYFAVVLFENFDTKKLTVKEYERFGHALQYWSRCVLSLLGKKENNRELLENGSGVISYAAMYALSDTTYLVKGYECGRFSKICRTYEEAQENFNRIKSKFGITVTKQYTQATK